MKAFSELHQLSNKHYDALISNHGFDDVNVLNYASAENQVLRFMVLAQIQNLEGCSILDVGCGLGDFSYYLKSRVKDFKYLGIDINQQMIEAAQAKYPDKEFRHSDIFSLNSLNPDYVFASGLFGREWGSREKSEAYFLKTIEKMYDVCEKGVAFNVLNAKYHPQDAKAYFTLTLPELYNICVKITPKLTFRHDYLEHDITAYMYK